nr:MAG TPA: hypothetical protein [Caudoviricetes sp.]
MKGFFCPFHYLYYSIFCTRLQAFSARNNAQRMQKNLCVLLDTLNFQCYNVL